MTLHVDILQADFAQGVQRRVARLYVDAQGVELDMSDDPERWKQKLLQPIPDVDTGELLDPGTAPKDFLRRLAMDMAAGSYLAAVGPHEDAGCLVPSDGVVSASEREGTDEPTHQASLRALIEAAEELPGVADVIETYGRLEPHVGQLAASVVPTTRYATGGNVSTGA